MICSDALLPSEDLARKALGLQGLGMLTSTPLNNMKLKATNLNI